MKNRPVNGGPVLNVDQSWRGRLAGASSPGKSQLEGWIIGPERIDGFVEPELSLIDGDPKTARLIFVSAPGAVGKSALARTLAEETKFALIDLAQTSPLGGNFFKGGLANAFGLNALSAAAAGEIGLIVDALDEAQLRAGPHGYEAGLLDLASISISPTALPSVLFGRAVAAEDAYILLVSFGYPCCLLQIEFFDEPRAVDYLRKKLPVIARRNPATDAAYNAHAGAFVRLAEETRKLLTQVQGGGEARFSGYAPVLDAICEFTLDTNELNPQARLATIGNGSQIELIRDITASILKREQKKLVDQLQEQHPGAIGGVADRLYTPDDQLHRIAAHIFGSAPPDLSQLLSPAEQATYAEMVGQFAPQHPFLSGPGGAANLVFAAYVIVWALTEGKLAGAARKAVRARPNLNSGMLFELYAQRLSSAGARKLPLADVGLLYHALSSQLISGQRAALEITGDEEDDALSVYFGVLEKVDPETSEARSGLEWGPFESDKNTYLELRAPFSNVSIDAPIWVELGDGTVQQIGAPVEIEASQLTISAKQVLIHGVSDKPGQEKQTVSIIVDECDAQNVQSVNVRDAILAVSWPDAKVFPWTHYVTEPSQAGPELAFMRRRLRKILTAFRSHSKGDLVRLAAKITHSRMTKDTRGVALVQRLLKDGILTTFDAGKFYILHPDKMGEFLGMDYQGLHQQRFTDRSDRYLESVLAGVK